MKYNHLFLGLACTAAFAFTACSDDDDNYQPGEWNAADGYANIFFEKTSNNIELDPADPTTATIQVGRRNRQGAISVSFDVAENTDNVFSVGTADFADGDSVATITVSFPNAEVGVPYTLELFTNDPNFVSYYSADVRHTLTVTRVKWNDAGYYYDDGGSKVTGWAAYTDDFITTFWGVDNLTFPTRLQERDDRPGYFRMVNTYGENYGYNDPGDWDDSQDYYIYIDATNPKQVFIPHYSSTGMNWGYGNIRVSSFAGYYLARNDAETAAEYYGTYENGKITFPESSLLISMPNYSTGGFYTANGNGAFKLVVDPDKDLYEATIAKDFDWEKLYVASFLSGQLGVASEPTVYKGNITTNKDNADKRFAEAYGVPYRVESPYAEGEDIYFCVRDGKIVVPEEIALQKTGLNAAGADVYVKINPNLSSYTDRVITLTATFQNESGSLVYGTAEEVISNITYSKVGTGSYVFSALEDEGVTETIDGYTLSKRDDKDDVYRIDNFGAGYLTEEGTPLVFSWDRKTNEVIIAANYSGWTHSSYGPVYVEDLPSYNSSNFPRSNYPSYFDPETSTFHFAVIYYVSAGYFGYGYETFQVAFDGGNAKVVRKSPRSYGSLRLTVDHRSPAQLVGKKSSPKTLRSDLKMPKVF